MYHHFEFVAVVVVPVTTSPQSTAIALTQSSLDGGQEYDKAPEVTKHAPSCSLVTTTVLLDPSA